jgi:hypothetical protein
LFVFHSHKGASRWKTNSFHRGERVPWFRREHETALRLQGHDRLQSHLAGRCSNRQKEPRDERCMAKPMISWLCGIEVLNRIAERKPALSELELLNNLRTKVISLFSIPTQEFIQILRIRFATPE